MQEHEIQTGKDYIVKIAHNQVKVRILSCSGHSWMVKTSGGKFMSVSNAERFVRAIDYTPAPADEAPHQKPIVPFSEKPVSPANEVSPQPLECGSVAPTGEVPLQASEAEGTETPATPPEAETTVTAAAIPPEPATVPTPAIPTTPAPIAPEKKLTMLDAAAKVLKDATAPMTVKEIIAAMEEVGLWKPGKGLTPANSLISAISTELKRKPNPRFRKTAPGTFEFAEGENHE